MEIFLIILGILAAIYFFFSLGITIFMLRPIRRTPEQLSIEELGIKQVDKRLYDIPYEELWVSSDKGYKLYARFYKTEGSDKYAVILHGHNAASSGVVRFMKIFLDRGYNVVLPDHRYSARSGGRTVTYGHQEKYDAIKFINYIRSINNNAKIGIMGESMGGATALLISGMRRDLEFCIDYCGYSDLDSLFRQSISWMFKPAIIFYPLVRVLFRIISGFSINSVSPKESAKNIDFPVLVMHSKADRLVRYSHHKAILDNLKDGEHIAFENSGHGLSLNTYPEQYIDGINAFLDRIGF